MGVEGLRRGMQCATVHDPLFGGVKVYFHQPDTGGQDRFFKHRGGDVWDTELIPDGVHAGDAVAVVLSSQMAHSLHLELIKLYGSPGEDLNVAVGRIAELEKALEIERRRVDQALSRALR